MTDTPADDRPSVERAKAYFSGRPPGLMSLETWMHGKRLVEALLAAEAALAEAREQMKDMAHNFECETAALHARLEAAGEGDTVTEAQEWRDYDADC